MKITIVNSILIEDMNVKVFNTVTLKYLQGFRQQKKYIKVVTFLKYSLRFGMQRKSMSANLMKNKYQFCY